MFFTPIDVAAYAARLLAPEPGTRVLDVGSGPGKFCIAAALAVPTAEFVGIEWRPHLVDVANALARDLGVTNARFIQGDATELDWAPFDAFYLFNPFGEHLFSQEWRLDHTLDLDPDAYVKCVWAVRQKLARASLGTRVVTYHGFGAPPPLGYEPSREDPIGYKRLELWIKTRAIMRDDADWEIE